jgi:hypothetical protein
MFVIDTAVLLPHPPHVVGRVAGRLTLLPRWCAGLRRVRFPAAPAPAAGCVFTYAAADLRLTLRAGPVASFDDPATTFAAGGAVTHAVTGDGLTLTWTLHSEAPGEPGPAEYGPAAPEGAFGAARVVGAGRPGETRLHARVEVVVDPGHPLAAARARLCRTVARRVPADLERLRTLLDRYEAGRTARAATP